MEGTCTSIRKGQRGARRCGPRLVPVQVTSRRGTPAIHEAQTVDAIVTAVVVKRRWQTLNWQESPHDADLNVVNIKCRMLKVGLCRRLEHEGT